MRYPLLDEALVEFSGDLTASLKVKGFKLRRFFKQALDRFSAARDHRQNEARIWPAVRLLAQGA